MRYLWFLIVWLLVVGKSFALEIPTLVRPVTDLTQQLTSAEIQEIESILYDLNNRKIVQGAVLIIPSLEGEVLEEYSIKVVDHWKLGDKKQSNGVLLLIAMKERKIRIEVGRGLEGDLTDLRSHRIIDKMKPSMKEGHLKDGIVIAISNIKDVVDHKTDNLDKEVDDDSSKWIILIAIIGCVALGLFFVILIGGSNGGRGSNGGWSSDSDSDSSYGGGGGDFGGGGSSGDF